MTDVRLLDERIEGLSHTFRVSLDAARVGAAVDSRLREMGPSIRVPGFRPGRAPLAILRARHGERVRSAIVDRIAIDVTRDLIAEKMLEPSRRPTIHIDTESDASAASVTFTLLLEVMPRVELAPLEGIPLRRLRVPDSDPALAAQAEGLLRRQLYDALLRLHDFPIPQDMLENEYLRIVRGFDTEVGEAVDAELDAEFRRIAARRIRLAILLTEIGRVHSIQVPRAEVEALVERQAERDPLHQAEIIDYYLDHPTALAELQSPLFEQRVVEFLLAQSDIEEVELGAADLQRELEAG